MSNVETATSLSVLLSDSITIGCSLLSLNFLSLVLYPTAETTAVKELSFAIRINLPAESEVVTIFYSYPVLLSFPAVKIMAVRHPVYLPLI